jgi:hypothetical protein
MTHQLKNHGYSIERDGPHQFEVQKRQPSRHKAVRAAKRLRSHGYANAHAEREEAA